MPEGRGAPVRHTLAEFIATAMLLILVTLTVNLAALLLVRSAQARIAA